MKLPAYALLQMSDQDNDRIESEMQNAVRWTMVNEGDGSSGKMKVVRADHPRILYRGQTQIYDPCMPSIARGFPAGAYAVSGLTESQQASLIHRLAMNCWFQAEIERHPMIAWTKAQNVAFDVAAIAQHYGIPTGYMDVSESFQVSAFFATCRFDVKLGEWRPMASGEGEGVMFRLDLNAVRGRTTPICYQPFPRPTLQWGWTTELLLGEDFLYAPSLQKFTFDHDKAVGEEIFRRYDGGEKLIAPDPTAEMAKALCDAKQMPKCFVDEVEAYLRGENAEVTAAEFNSIRKNLTELLHIDLVERTSAGFTADQLKRAEADWAAWEPDFWGAGIGFQLVRTRPPENS